MTDFVVSAVQDAAQRAIEQAEVVRLSLADQACFAQALLSPPQPALALKRAFELPRHPTVPAVRMGRLAVDQAFKGQGLGGALLADALDRAARAEIAAFALIVDAKDEAAGDFYRHHGFMALPDSPLTLFLPLATVRRS
jgi:GNAT superfamily N-acetyltransferase